VVPSPRQEPRHPVRARCAPPTRAAVGRLDRQGRGRAIRGTLSTPLGNDTLLSGLSIVKETMTNTVLAALEGVTAKLREGKGFSAPLAETNCIRGSRSR
jgi:hypothetical protein